MSWRTILENSYDQNMATLDNDVYALTSLVQSCIRDYIYAETLNFDQIKAQLDENNRTIFCFTILASLLVVILTVGLSVRAARNITGPIRNLCMLTCKVAGGDFTAQTKDVESGDEIALLMDNFNDMTKEIGQLVEDMKRNHETLRLSETKLLQAQINPHFLYNTLDSIAWMCERGKNADAVQMVHALARLFRISISRGHELIPIEKELQHAEAYLQIQKYRYKNQFTYHFTVDESCTQYLCNKITLQPIIENAIYHGLDRMVDEGRILIRIYSEGEDVVFRVEDNGVGMSEEQCRSILHKEPGDNSGIGIKNVNDRIKIYFGKEYGLSIESELDEGTTVIIRMPKVEENAAAGWEKV